MPINAINVGAVIVTYQPDIEAVEQALKLVSKQVARTVVVDNASSNQSALKNLCHESSSDTNTVELICLDENLGLGAAHNQGIKSLASADEIFTHVLILDQDSKVEPDLVSVLANAWLGLSDEPKLAVLGSHYKNQGENANSFFVRFSWLKLRRIYCETSDCSPVKTDCLISSGSLFSLAVLEDVGLMDETLFIDHVDTEWFLRAAAQGYQFFGVCQAKMTHGLGEKLHRIKLIRERFVPQHKPFRYYYTFRNSVCLYRKKYADKRWLWNDLQRLFSIFIMYGVFVGPRRQHLTMMWRGFRDGVKGVSGPMQ